MFSKDLYISTICRYSPVLCGDHQVPYSDSLVTFHLEQMIVGFQMLLQFLVVSTWPTSNFILPLDV